MRPVPGDVEGGVEAYIREQRPEHQEIIRRLRRVILEAAPELREGIKWGNPCYILGGKEKACSIYAISDHVNLAFFRGRDLMEMSPILEGTGKRMRHIKFGNTEALDSDVIGRLVRKAVEIAAR